MEVVRTLGKELRKGHNWKNKKMTGFFVNSIRVNHFFQLHYLMNTKKRCGKNLRIRDFIYIVSLFIVEETFHK